MAAPKGNKFALNNVGNTSRTVSFCKDEMISLGKEMIKWVIENQETILHLSEWYTIHKMFTYKQWKTFIQREEFIPYYEQALKIVGNKYLDKNSNVRDGISQRWQRSYFQDLTEKEDQDAEEEKERQKRLAEHLEKLKAQSQSAVPPMEELLKMEDKLNKVEYENQQLKKQLDDLKSKAAPELQ